MGTDLFRRKMDTVFGMFDVTRDSYVDRSDIDTLIAGFGGEESSGFRSAAERFWESLQQMDSDGDGRIDAGEFAAGVEKLFREQDQFDVLMAPLVSMWFSVFDADGSGGIDVNELEAALGYLGRSKEDAQVAFPKLDTNQDGAITKDEWVDLVRAYCLDDDPTSPGNWIFGPPPEA